MTYKDVREYAEILLGKGDFYQIPSQIQVSVYVNAKGKDFTFIPRAIKRNHGGRPRLVTDNGDCVEFSHCTLCDLINLIKDIKVEVNNLRYKALQEQLWNEFSSYNYDEIVEGLSHYNIKASQPLIKSLTKDPNNEILTCCVDWLRTHSRVLNTCKELDGKNYCDMSMRERCTFHHVEALKEGRSSIVEHEISYCYSNAFDCDVTFPVITSIISDFNGIVNRLTELGVHSLYYASRSTKCLDDIFTALTNKAQISPCTISDEFEKDKLALFITW